MKRLLLILSLAWAHQGLAQEKITIVSLKIPVEEARVRDQLRAIETYEGTRIHALRIASQPSEQGQYQYQYTKNAGEVLSKEEITLKNGDYIRTSDVAYVYVLREKAQAPGPKTAAPAEQGKHPNTDGTSGTTSN